MYQHSFMHETFDEIQWGKLVSVFSWLLRICPDFHDAQTSLFPRAPLRGHLTAWSKTVASDGTLDTSFPVLIDHEDASPVQWDGEPAIMFYGQGLTSSDAFVLGQGNTRGWVTMDTEGKPYDLLVCTMLILANHLVPGAIRIKSESPAENWEPALSLARTAFDDQIEMPAGIQSRAQIAMAAARVSTPSHLDFRA